MKIGFKNILLLVVVAIVANPNGFRVANAASVSVTCRQESEVDRNRFRSKVTVRGQGLQRGKYYAKIQSGGGAWIKSAKAKAGRSVQFEFDSNTEFDSTMIPENFIVGGVVVGVIRKVGSNGKVGSSMSATCENRVK